jgi:hypothetical protein
MINLIQKEKREFSSMLQKNSENIRYEKSSLHCYQALPTDRINLSPFTKDFRVWGAFIEIVIIFLKVSHKGDLLKVLYY